MVAIMMKRVFENVLDCVRGCMSRACMRKGVKKCMKGGVRTHERV